MIRTVTARYVFPANGPPLPGGLLSLEGDRIVAVKPAGTRTADEDFGNAAILPGLVNAHTHLDLSGARGLIPPTDPDHFTEWLRGVIAYRIGRSAEQVREDIRDGLKEVLQSGTTLVGDITSGGASWDVLVTSPLRSWVFFELIGLDERKFVTDARRTGRLIGWAFDSPRPLGNCKTDTSQTKGGLSPHAPYSVHGRIARNIMSGIVPTATHVAETSQEGELLERRTGSFVQFLTDLGVYQPEVLVDSWTRYLAPWNESSKGISNCLVIHANYLQPDFSFWPHQSVVYCPRTHAAFGHPPHPFRELLARGVRVCLGTDSLASNPDLDILAEARFVRSRYPDFPGEQLLKMISLSGAEALGWADECGSLEVGKSADFVVVPLPNGEERDPHDLFLKDGSPPSVRSTMFRGEWRD